MPYKNIIIITNYKDLINYFLILYIFINIWFFKYFSFKHYIRIFLYVLAIPCCIKDIFVGSGRAIAKWFIKNYIKSDLSSVL